MKSGPDCVNPSQSASRSLELKVDQTHLVGGRSASSKQMLSRRSGDNLVHILLSKKIAAIPDNEKT